VYCPLAEVERRERVCGDRLVGFTRWHFDTVHAYLRNDIEVDSAHHTPQECAQQISARLLSGPPLAFQHLLSRAPTITHPA